MIAEKMKPFVQNNSAIRMMFEEGNRLRAKYGADKVYDFSLGNPNVPAPEAVKEAALHVLNEEDSLMVHGYMSNSGYEDVRKAVADSLNNRFGTHYDESNLVMTVGAAGGMNVIFKTLLNPGDEVIAFAPYFGEYRAYVTNYDGVLKVVSPNTETFQPNLEAFEELLTEKTKAVIVNTPNNPTGEVYSDEQLAAIAAIAEKHDLLVISDEVYNTLLYTGAKFRSIAELPGMKARTVVVNSFSKSYAMTGWRIGYAAGPADIIDRMVKCQENFNACANAPGQYAAAIALEHPELSEQLCTVFAGRRKLLLAGLAGIDGIVCSQPEGAFYAFPDISTFGLTSQEFCEQLLERQKVVCIPGSAFGACGEGHIRVAYTCEEGMLQAAVERLHQFCREVRGA